MDPLTAVVLLAIAGAAAAVAILQMDQDATGSVELPIDAFSSGDLPSVCCKTGQPAEAMIKVEQRRWFRTVIEGTVPVTNARLIEFSGWRDVYRRAVVGFNPLAAVGLTIRLGADLLLVSWAVDLALLSVVFFALYSRTRARRLLVSPRRNSDGNITVRAVHPAFVDAVRASRQPAP